MLEAMETHCLETLRYSFWICQSVSTSLRDNVRDLFRVIVLLLGQPTPGAGSAANMRRAPIVYWMTSSARPSSDGGIVRPRAFAVLTLYTSPHSLGFFLGRSALFLPLKNHSHCTA